MECKDCKNKSEKKDLMLKVEEIEQESRLHEVIVEESDLMFMLIARSDKLK